MRILHVSTALTWRGGEQQAIYLAKELKQKGVDQLMVCAEGAAIEEACKREQISFSTIAKKAALDFSFAKNLKRIADEFKPDLIHLHDSHGHTAAVIATDLYKLKVPLVLSRRVDFPVKKSFLSKYKYNHKSIAKIVCVSEKIMQITGASIADQSKLTVVYDGVDPSRFNQQSTGILHEEHGLDSKDLIVGNTSALADHKDYTTFVKVAAKIRSQRKDVAFFIVGDGDEKQKIKDLIDELNLSEAVFLTGFRNDIPAILPEFDVFLMPSKLEGLGTSLFDAMACKVPIVTTNAGGIPEIIEHEKIGLMADPGDVGALEQHVLRILDDQNLSEKLVQGGTDQLMKFTSKVMAEATLKVYESI